MINLIRLLLPLVLIAMVFFAVMSVVGFVLPAVPLAFLMMTMIAKTQPGYTIKRHLIFVKNLKGKAIGGLLYILATSGAITVAVFFTFSTITDIFNNHHVFDNLMTTVLMAGLGFGSWIIFEKVLKGEMMKDIFDLVDDPVVMDNFINDRATPVVIDVNPERDIPLIKQVVIGQDLIVESVVNSIARRVRQARPNKPLGVYGFFGATGAGKTELAKAIANQLFGGRILEVEMNSLKSLNDLNTLIGPPAGYVGSDKGGTLTQGIKRLKSAVILLDEFEKAGETQDEKKAFADTFMKLFDEGRIADKSTGEVMDASNCVIILTSNAEQQALSELAEKITDQDDLARATKDALVKDYKPEHLARIDEIYCYKKLSRTSLVKIIGKFIMKMADNAEVNLVGLDQAILINLVTRFEKQSAYGIRMLVQLIEKAVVDGFYVCKDAGFTKVRINFVYDEKNPEGKPVVVGVPDDVEQAAVTKASTLESAQINQNTQQASEQVNQQASQASQSTQASLTTTQLHQEKAAG